jgi:hypothetical protein
MPRRGWHRLNSSGTGPGALPCASTWFLVQCNRCMTVITQHHIAHRCCYDTCYHACVLGGQYAWGNSSDAHILQARAVQGDLVFSVCSPCHSTRPFIFHHTGTRYPRYTPFHHLTHLAAPFLLFPLSHHQSFSCLTTNNPSEILRSFPLSLVPPPLLRTSFLLVYSSVPVARYYLLYTARACSQRPEEAPATNPKRPRLLEWRKDVIILILILYNLEPQH